MLTCSVASAGDGQDRTVDRAERTAARFGDDHGLADAYRELAENTERHRKVECHARPELGGDTGVEAQNAALARVGRERDADVVARALLEVIGIAGAVDHLLASDMRRLAGGTGTDRRERRLQTLLTYLLHIDRQLRHRGEPGAAHQGGVVTIMAAGHFEEHRLVHRKLAATPGAVRYPRAAARRDQRLPAHIFGNPRDRPPHHARA